jgi:uncharacterized membrane protein
LDINGVPYHPLIVHAVVVFVPLGALSAILFALVPKWRWLFRWPTLLLAVAGVALIRAAVITGLNLKDSRGLDTAAITRHQTWANRLEIAFWVFAVIAIVAWWVLPYVVPLVGRVDRPSPVASLAMPVSVLLTLAAVAVLVLVVITGDAGAKAVWKIS